MYYDIIALQSFYASSLGQAVQERIALPLRQHYPCRPDERVMGLGFTTPWLDEFAVRSERCFAMFPARHGVQVWPTAQNVASCLAFEENLPLPDGCLDRILLVHALEYVENAEEALRELWRVLVPYGHIIIVVTNRHGPWSGADHTPFGNGEPYSRGQLSQILRLSGFVLHTLTESLHLWPYKKDRISYFSPFYEQLSQRLFPYFGGVLIAQAQKQTEPLLPARQKLSRRLFIPTLSPQPQLSA